jgi:hypothetical protein
VRPDRSDIAVPDFPPSVAWIGDGPGSMSRLTAAGPVLVHFFDFAQLNSVRSMPYVLEWHRRYEELGLKVFGVQAPRFEFGADGDAVAAGLRRLGVVHPVAIDSDRDIWLDYGCRGWPSLFLWGRGGALCWFHFGEGEYAATESAIQEELRGKDALRDMPEPMEPLRPTDAPGAAVMPPSEEVFPAGEGEGLLLDEGAAVELRYEAGGAHATLDGDGEIDVAIDDGAPVRLRVKGAGLYELTRHSRHEAHSLSIEWASGEPQLWSVSFAAGVP